jgi:hypothetical protein
MATRKGNGTKASKKGSKLPVYNAAKTMIKKAK